MTIKQALDSAAIDYWTQYFGEYGKQWVRNIPRNVKSAMVADLRRQAGQDTAEVVNSSVIPLGYAIQADRVVLDGMYRGTYSDGRREGKLFQAQFDHDGKLLALKSRRAPAV